MKVYFIEARPSYLNNSWYTLNYTLDEKEAKDCVDKIESLNDSVADYYSVESEKNITGYDNGGGDHFICLVRVCRYANEEVSKLAVFNTREEALEFINTAEDNDHYCTLDGIQLASERKSWKAGKYSNWA